MYELLAADVTEREPEDVKRYFWETMCNKEINPTDIAVPDPRNEPENDIHEKAKKSNSKRKASNKTDDSDEDDEDIIKDNKSKNVRSTPRAGRAGALMKMADAMNREVDLRA